MTMECLAQASRRTRRVHFHFLARCRVVFGVGNNVDVECVSRSSGLNSQIRSSNFCVPTAHPGVPIVRTTIRQRESVCRVIVADVEISCSSNCRVDDRIDALDNGSAGDRPNVNVTETVWCRIRVAAIASRATAHREVNLLLERLFHHLRFRAFTERHRDNQPGPTIIIFKNSIVSPGFEIWFSFLGNPARVRAGYRNRILVELRKP